MMLKLFLPLSFFLSVFLGVQAELKAQFAVAAADSLALLRLYQALDGPNWNIPSNQTWDGSRPVATWFGLELQGSAGPQTVRAIRLPNANLSGIIPAGVFHNALEDLAVLDLSQNQIRGYEAPLFNNNHFYLDSFDLSQNQLQGFFDLGAGQTDFFNLRYLNLSSNFLLRFNFPKAESLESIDLSNNLLRALEYRDLPTGLPLIQPPYQNLRRLNIQNNLIDYLDLGELVGQMKFVWDSSSVNPSGYVSRNSLLRPSFVFNYAPQKPRGVGGVRRRPARDSIVFIAPVREPDLSPSIGIFGSILTTNQCKWYRRQQITGPVQLVATAQILANGLAQRDNNLPNHQVAPALNIRGQQSSPEENIAALMLNNLDSNIHNNNFYEWRIFNAAFPALDSASGGIRSLAKRVLVGNCFDDLGREVRCQEVLVKYDANISNAARDSVRESLGAEVLERCSCGDLEWWAMSDTMAALSLEQNGRGSDASSQSIKTRPELLSASSNYNLNQSPWTNTEQIRHMPRGSSSDQDGAVIVAVIDAGLDTDHPILSPRVWIHSQEIPDNGANENGSCLTDDAFGYDFVEKNPVPVDDHGHGTQVSGVIAGYSQPNIQALDPNDSENIRILPLKFTNARNEGTVFHASCALYYAADFQDQNNKVRVINASWGHYGAASEVLEQALNYTDSLCHILVLSSAGNNGSDNDQTPHYPSNFELRNLMAVASLAQNDSNRLANFSNYGASKVDLAAEGYVQTTQSVLGPLDQRVQVEGSSFATAQVSRAAALLFEEFPDASPAAVRYALRQGATSLQSNDAQKLASRGRLNLQAARSVLANLSPSQRSDCSLSLGTQLALLPSTNQAWTFWPNPSFGLLNWRHEQAQHGHYQILSLEGRLLHSGQWQGQTELNLKHLPQGFYLLGLESQGQWSWHKWTKY